MNLHDPKHPQSILNNMIAGNADAYGRVRGGLDVAAQEACGIWAQKYPDLDKINQNVLASDIRQLLAYYLQTPIFEKTGVRITVGTNCSLSLGGISCVRNLIRKHPQNLATAELIRTTEYPSLTLFGEDYNAVEWKPYVTWTLDLKRQVLANAWIAAISNIRSFRKATVYGMAELPPAIMPEIGNLKPLGTDPEEGHWPDWTVEKGGDTPA